MEIDFLLFEDKPIDRPALGLAIFTGKQYLKNRLEKQGDDWLADEDDPFISVQPGLCWIRNDAAKTSSGRSRMTYRTLLTVYEAYWNVLFLSRNERESSMRIHVAGQLSGYAAVTINDPAPSSGHESTSES